MDSKKDYRIAMVLYTTGLDYDDRVRKEITSVQKLYSNIKFKIFAITPENKGEEGTTSYGVEYKTLHLASREKYPSASHTMAKAWDFYKTVSKEIKPFDAVWCADPETILTVLLTTGKPIVWDLHELPEGYMHQPIKKILFRMAERRTEVTIHANEPRVKHLVELGLIRNGKKQYVLRNYPQFNEIDEEYDETYNRFVDWLGNDKCVYLQGLTTEKRADMESIEAVLAFSDLKAVVVGNTDKRRMEQLKEKQGADFTRRVFFTGQIKQLKTPQYIRKCCMSLIFYKNTVANNWYCEPNRLFQNLVNDIPVVVGNNPPMKEIVEQYGVGICANTDGSDVREIIAVMKKLYADTNTIKKNICEHKNKWLWDSQNGVINEIVKKAFAR